MGGKELYYLDNWCMASTIVIVFPVPNEKYEQIPLPFQQNVPGGPKTTYGSGQCNLLMMAATADFCWVLMLRLKGFKVWAIERICLI